MKNVDGKRPVFQGDMMIRRIDALPEEVEKVDTNIVAHSETGHHHTVSGAEVFRSTVNPMVMFVKLTDTKADVKHHRPFDTHETLRLLGDTPGTVFQINRQREHTPEGWRMVAD